MLSILRFGVCRSSDSSIQAARLIAAYDLAPYCQHIASAFSPGHDSPSNDRFSPHAGIPRMENNTLESQLLSESCRALAISNVQTAILRWIRSVSGIFTRFPCSANKHACPICRAGQGQSFHLDEATSVLRVAHVPQKPCYLVYICVPNFTHTKRPLLPCYLAGKRSLVFSIYSVSVYAKITFLFK